MPKFIFFLAVFALFAGCSLLQKEPRPNIENTPPYYQNDKTLTEAQMYHNDSVKGMAEGVHIVRNREMEELEKANKLAEKDELWEQDYQKTMERRSKWSNWFKKGQDETLMMSDKAKEINRNLK
ncbi:MAG: hypothetical protein LBT89_01470 [Planctomycetaceae bacterium]|jgi:hypothetical protein|nr:hypothetical protein [Planctomycetaceae bacterium]